MRPIHRPVSAVVSLCAVVTLAAGCSTADAAGDAWVGRTDTLGDTIVVTSVSGAVWGERSPVVIDSVTTLWRSDSLERPQLLVRTSDELLVAEETYIWRIRGDGSLVGVIGRSGDGPGEFRSIVGLGVIPGDTILVLDGLSFRLTRFDGGGNLIDNLSIERPAGSNNMHEAF